MTFDANDAAGGGGIRREILTWDDFSDAARSLDRIDFPWSAQPPVEVEGAAR